MLSIFVTGGVSKKCTLGGQKRVGSWLKMTIFPHFWPVLADPLPEKFAQNREGRSCVSEQLCRLQLFMKMRSWAAPRAGRSKK